MSRDFGKVASTFWTGDTGKKIRALGTEAQLVALYLMTGPNANMIGLYHLPLPLAAYHMANMPLKGLLKTLESLREEDFVRVDSENDSVFVPQMAKFQIGETLKASDNQVKHIKKELRKWRKSQFYKDFLDIYADRYALTDMPPYEGPSKGGVVPPSKPGTGEGAGTGDRTGAETGTGKGAGEFPKGTQSADADLLDSKAPSLAEQVAEVYSVYLEHHPRAAARLAPKSKEYLLIRDRLAEGFTVASLKEAIDGNHKSPWHCGQNEKGRQYHDLALIFRSQSHTTRFIEYANGKSEVADPRGNFAARDEYLSMFPPEEVSNEPA